MIANYSDDPELFERCINLINEVFPGCKEFALKGMKYNASWEQASIPFIVEENGEIIAHAGVWPLSFMLNSKLHHSASIHGACVKPEHRGKGYFKQLMQEVMHYVDNKFDSSVLFTVKPYLYQSYPYRTMLPEYDFILDQKWIVFNEKKSDLRTLTLDIADDLNLVHHLLASRVPLSNQFSLIEKNANTLFILNTLHKNLHYSEKLNVLIIYEIKNNNTLVIQEIVSQKSHEMSHILELIPENFEKVVLHFCPDNYLDEKEYSAVLAGPECCIMVSDKFSFKGKCFRYPELYWC